MPENGRAEQQIAQQRADAQANLAAGYCPCGDERDHDCECFGTYRLAVAQGKTAPERIRAS